MVDHIEALFGEMTTTTGDTVAGINQKHPVLLVFLRFFGCSFCREAIGDLAAIKEELYGRNIKLVFVHMAPDPSTAESFFQKYKLFPVHHISDPQCQFYQRFGLVKTSPAQLMGLRNWIRGFQASVIEGHGFDAASDALGDGFQMPGVFFLRNGKIVNQFIHKMAYDRPDYLKLVES